jgi:outer membrane protein assembly factor BamD (BamD/ComL family)
MLSSKILLTKLLPVLIAVACILGATGCEKKKTAAELQKEKVDAFRKHQKIEAIKAYTDLVNKYPESEHIAEAKAKLQALGPMPATPTPVKKK